MKKRIESMALPEDVIISKIYMVRGQKVMLDEDLGALYGVDTGNLNKAVNRNLKRFPNDFLFRLTEEEYKILKFQIGISSWGGRRNMPLAFTEQGVAMLSSVLHSERSITVNIAIMRAFVQMRKFLETHKDLALKIEELERTVASHDENIQLIFETIRQMIVMKNEPMEPVGFKIAGDNSVTGREQSQV